MSKCSDCAYCTMCAANAGAGGYLFNPEHEGEKYCPMFCASKKPMTNGDRIRAMTDREIAEWLPCPAAVEGKRCFYPGPREKMCLQCCFDWLREPVKEDAE